MPDKFRSHYSQLNQIASLFISQGTEITVLLHTLRGKQEQLEAGDWQGDAADRFFAEMNDSIRPALQRLAHAMGEAAVITRKIAKLTKEAEESSSRIFVIQIGPKS